MKIAVDAMGGDHAPGVVVEGAIMAAKAHDLSIILVGDSERVHAELKKHACKDKRISVVHASQVVLMDESPAQAIRKKKDSSLKVCFDLVKAGEAGSVVSAGNSGAAMAAGMFLFKKIKGVDRPAIAVTVPTKKKPAVILDVGGNVDCKGIHLAQFGVMGSVYARCVLKTDNPRVGVLSNGEEEAKGTDLTREAHAILKGSNLNYIGYIEGRDIFHGDVDVIVTDGFVGNVVLKLTEGLIEAFTSMLKDEIMVSTRSKIGYMLAKGAFARVKKKVDYSEYGGAPLLGLNGVCIISHGRSNAKAMKNAICRANEFYVSKVNEHLAQQMLMDGALDVSGRLDNVVERG